MKAFIIASFVLLGFSAAQGSTLKNRIYVANEEEGTISVIDTQLNSVVKTMDTMKGAGSNMSMFMAHNVQVAPDQKTVWVTAVAMSEGGHAVWGGEHGGSSPNSDEVIVFDVQTDRIVQRIQLGADLHVAHVILDPNSKFAFITATNSDEIIQVDAKTFHIIRKIKFSSGFGPHGARMCAGKLFVAGMNGTSLGVVQADSGKVREVAIGGVAVQTACEANGSVAFVSLYDTKEVVRYELSSGQITRLSLPVESQGPAQITISPDNSKLLVADQGLLLNRPSSNLVYEVNPKTMKIQETYQVGDGAHGIAISKSGQFAYVTSQSDSKVTMIDLQAKKVVRDILVGRKPNGISILD